MNSRQRFLESMRFGNPDHPPLFQEGLRDDVLERWLTQGLGSEAQLAQLFDYDQREEISLELFSRLDPVDLVRSPRALDRWQRSLNSAARRSLPRGWQKQLGRWRERQHVLMLQVHSGFFETLEIGDSRTFTRVIYLINDHPDFVRAAMAMHGEITARLLERFLEDVRPDAAVFSEPISDNHGPLISPSMYSELALPAYGPILDVLSRFDIDIVILRTYANTRALLPVILGGRINCLWSVESESQDMDYRSIRQQFGQELRLIGGIDVDVLRRGELAVRQELEAKVKPLLAQGGYIPLADGRVRADMPFANYSYYRQLLERIVKGG